jgi:hypothetical protein
MADDLSDLDVLSPAGTDAVSSGDDAIRDTRRQVRNWADVEHDRQGPHEFKFGAVGARPSAGNAGRPFFNTILGRLELDNGAQWNMLHAVQVGSAYTDGSVALTTASQVVQTVTMDLANYALVAILGSALFYNGAAADAWGYLVLQFGATPVTPVNMAERLYITKPYQRGIVFAPYTALVNGGSLSVNMLAYNDTHASGVTLAARNLIVLAF